MSAALTVQPDVEFLDGVLAGGGGDLKKCFQCATCSSVCSLSTGGRPFPRKQMAEAQWGLSQRLVGDPAVWLCHQCGDCSTRCPRGARPGDVLAAVRREVIKRVAFPRFMGNLVSNPLGVWALFTVPLFVLALIAVLPPHADSSRGFEFAQLFPQARVEALFFALSAAVLLALIVGSVRLLRAFRASGADGPLLPALLPVLGEIVTHRRFSSCEEQQGRSAGHMLLFFGFAGLAVVGTVTGIGSLAGAIHTPLPLLSPLKILANVCAAVILVGAVAVLVERVRDPERRRASTYFDWFFLLTLAGVAVTGIFSELLRLQQSETWMFTVYFVHLVLIFALFISAPYSKFAHFIYRTLAMAVTWQRREPSTQPDRFLPAAVGDRTS
jgi:quinone-modifying oxidoreductase, subunit QmoC